jgi:protease YdgD
LVEGGACPLARDYDAASWPAIARDFEDADRLVLHTCDTGGASSGSPLLIDGPNGPTVVAINVGTYVQSRVLMQDGVVVHRYAADNVANTAVNALSFQASLAAMRDAGVTASRAQLRDLQAALRRHGYYDGPLDGVYDRAMRTAIEAFEREARMPVTGLATRSLRAQLEGYKGPGAKLRAATGQRPETAGETLAADAR